MKKIVLIIVLGFLVIYLLPTILFSIFSFIYKNPADFISCYKEGGKYIVKETPSMPSRQLFSGDGYVCKYSYTDSGKVCYSNNDCQGICLVTEDTIIENDAKTKGLISIPKVVGGSGKCASTNYFPNGHPGDFDVPIMMFY